MHQCFSNHRLPNPQFDPREQNCLQQPKSPSMISVCTQAILERLESGALDLHTLTYVQPIFNNC